MAGMNYETANEALNACKRIAPDFQFAVEDGIAKATCSIRGSRYEFAAVIKDSRSELHALRACADDLQRVATHGWREDKP